ncbi:hypothetical protein Ddc_06983 [Ditylenchus destructor]|nr:hypothetical protein Ddc_06983 [Ditylenchus destructor]
MLDSITAQLVLMPSSSNQTVPLWGTVRWLADQRVSTAKTKMSRSTQKTTPAGTSSSTIPPTSSGKTNRPIRKKYSTTGVPSTSFQKPTFTTVFRTSMRTSRPTTTPSTQSSTMSTTTSTSTISSSTTTTTTTETTTMTTSTVTTTTSASTMSIPSTSRISSMESRNFSTVAFNTTAQTKFGMRNMTEKVPIIGMPSEYNTTVNPYTDEEISSSTEFEYDYSQLEHVILFFGQCNTTVFDQSDRRVVNILLYFTAGWMTVWCLLTIITNVVYKQLGHTRFLDLYQELGFLVVYIFMGVFVLMPDSKSLCTATTMVLHFFMVFILIVGFMQAFFASSLIRGSSIKDGRLPPAVNYIWPAIVAAAPTVITYFTNRDHYASTGVHCFVSIYSNLFWPFVITAWVIWFIVLIRNQLSITACRLTRNTVDKEQLYWARKTCKALPILLSWFLMTYFALLFAVDMQIFWLCILYTVVVLIFGPLVFIVHTYNHTKTCNGLYSVTHLTFYKPCPPRKVPIAPGPPPPAPPPPPPDLLQKNDSHEESAPVPPQSVVMNPSGTPGTSVPAPVILSSVNQPVPPSARSQAPDVPTGPASAQQFYDWLTDRNEENMHERNLMFGFLNAIQKCGRPTSSLLSAQQKAWKYVGSSRSVTFDSDKGYERVKKSIEAADDLPGVKTAVKTLASYTHDGLTRIEKKLVNIEKAVFNTQDMIRDFTGYGRTSLGLGAVFEDRCHEYLTSNYGQHEFTTDHRCPHILPGEADFKPNFVCFDPPMVVECTLKLTELKLNKLDLYRESFSKQQKVGKKDVKAILMIFSDERTDKEELYEHAKKLDLKIVKPLIVK